MKVLALALLFATIPWQRGNMMECGGNIRVSFDGRTARSHGPGYFNVFKGDYYIAAGGKRFVYPAHVVRKLECDAK